jgi:hypothetical protein
MFCDKCGASILPGQKYCSNCGKQIGTLAGPPTPEPASPPQNIPMGVAKGRIEKHVRILGILWIVASILGLIPGIWFFIGSGVAMHFLPLYHIGFPFPPFLWPLAGVIGTFLLASSVAGLLAGWGLLNYRPWARTLALILGIIWLIHLPFGTALGIYTLWVLLPAESEQEYRRMARTAY